MKNLSFEYSPWFILLCLLAGVLLAFMLYYRQRHFAEERTSFKKWLLLMSVLRALVVSFIAFLLLAPVVRFLQTSSVKPVIVVAQDNSSSVRHGWKAEDSIAYCAELNALIERLSEKYEVNSYSFGDEWRNGLDFSFDGKSTNLSDAIQRVNDLYFGQNLGALVLASDGIYNQGSHPMYAMEKMSAAVYTIAMGDTAGGKDVRIENIYFNNIVYAGDRMQIDADIRSLGFPAQSLPLELYLVQGKTLKKISSQALQTTTGNFFSKQSFITEAPAAGLLHFRLQIKQLPGEMTYRNNSRDFFVEVLDSKQRILILAQSPHPDIYALKQTIDYNKNYELKVVYPNSGFNEKPEAYNLVIFHQLPSANAKLSSFFPVLREKGIPSLFILGSQTSLGDFNNVQKGLQILSRNAQQKNEVTAKVNSDFSLFQLSEEQQSMIAGYPPLTAAFADYKMSGSEAQYMLYQKIGSVNSNYPLIAFNENESWKTAYICGEGIWRWRLHNYAQKENFDVFQQVFGKLVQYMTVKSDKRPFRLSLPKNIFTENERLYFEAQSYNASYELVNEADVSLILTDESGKEYSFQFSRNGKAYSVDVGSLPVGTYQYRAQTNLAGKTHSVSGAFSVSPLELENSQLQANHALLYGLSKETGGQMYYPGSLNKLADQLQNDQQIKPILYDSYKTIPLIFWKWFFAMLLLFLSLEWFLRKYFGSY